LKLEVFLHRYLMISKKTRLGMYWIKVPLLLAPFRHFAMQFKS
jgi:hypothetical protein